MDYTPTPSVRQAALPAESTDIQANASTSVDAIPGNTATELLSVEALPAAERAADGEVQTAPPALAGAASGTASLATNTATTTNTIQPLPIDAKTTDAKVTEVRATVKATAKLKLSFSQISWVNVTDQNKKMIFDRIMPAGSEEMVEGEPPFEVVVGNAPGSKLVFNDKPVDLAPYTKSNVARVTLE
jgi:cytoskeleton protein RodZ